MKPNQTPGHDSKPPAEVATDVVEEASKESFPASDPPAWTVSTGQKGSGTQGCAPSFLMQKRGEKAGVCGEPQPDPDEEYVQPDKEKEAGGEG